MSEADAEKRFKAWALRKAGAAYDQIAQQAGYEDGTAAYEAVAEAARAAHQDSPDDTALLEVQRLDQLLMALWPKAMQGQGWAADRILQAMELRRGYNPPGRSTDDPVEERRSVVDAVKTDLADLPERLQQGALAAAALELARTIDQGLNQAGSTKELRAVMAELRTQAPVQARGDAVDELNKRRAARRRRAADGS